MMFNNGFTSGNRIHFVQKDWETTDVDEFQYCRKISNTEFEYIQLKNKTLIEECQHINPTMVLEYLDGKTTPKDWWQDEIDINDYDADKLGEYVASYGGDDYLGNSKGALRNQLIAECIFEQDIVFSGDYD